MTAPNPLEYWYEVGREAEASFDGGRWSYDRHEMMVNMSHDIARERLLDPAKPTDITDLPAQMEWDSARKAFNAGYWSTYHDFSNIPWGKEAEAKRCRMWLRMRLLDAEYETATPDRREWLDQVDAAVQRRGDYESWPAMRTACENGLCPRIEPKGYSNQAITDAQVVLTEMDTVGLPYITKDSATVEDRMLAIVDRVWKEESNGH